MKKKILIVMLLLLSMICSACANTKEIADGQRGTSNNAAKTSDGNARLEPARGCYFGVVMDTTRDNARDLSARLNFAPASYVTFVKFPMDRNEKDRLNGFVKDIAPTGGVVLITLEPLDGLDAINKKDCQDFAELCAGYEKKGLGVMIRFAHEMNGSWYPWGQKPALYKEKFRLLAQHIHASTKNAAMLWAPNSGSGYPFSGGPHEVKPGTPDYSVLDTDGNNLLDMKDDMYTPYYPGDDAVDWVGMTVYHWGQSYPWFENELPEPRSFTDHITGNYNGRNGDQRAVPDFYAMFCSDGTHNKPMAIPETAAFYNTEQTGADELEIKKAWWRQVFNISGDTDQALDISVHFPKIKMINWFNIQKKEAEAKGNLVDWRITGKDEVLGAFIRDLQLTGSNNPYFLSAKEFRAQKDGKR